jgi:xanthine dehydrogenase accessory factor
MSEWIDDLSEQITGGNACVLVTVAGTRGSAPREAGAKMLVTERETIGTIGGGQLEYECAQIAYKFLRDRIDGSSFRKFTLGANLGQCCGGVVDVLFESFSCIKPDWLDDLRAAYRQRVPVVVATSAKQKYLFSANGECLYSSGSTVDNELLVTAMRVLDRYEGANKIKVRLNDESEQEVLFEPIRSSSMQVAIFGAGHVGTAIVRVMASLDCDIRWVDNRRNIFPDRVPRNVQTIECERPELEVTAMHPGAVFLIMTHSHALDLEVVRQVLQRDDFSYCGLIGSMSKRRQFEKRLRKLGVQSSRLQRLTCPIGIEGIVGKKPAEIAIAVVAELLQISHAIARPTGEEVPDNVRFLHE